MHGFNFVVLWNWVTQKQCGQHSTTYSLEYSVRKQPTFRYATMGLRREMTSERAQTFHADDASPPRSGKCVWLAENSLHQYGISALVSHTSETLVPWHSSQRHFAGKPVVESRNVGCFLRLPLIIFARILKSCTKLVHFTLGWIEYLE